MSAPSNPEREALLDRLTECVPVLAAKVAPIYRLLDWRWCDASAPPTEKEIVDTLIALIADLRDGSVASRTGGLEVWVEDDDECGASAGVAMSIMELVV